MVKYNTTIDDVTCTCKTECDEEVTVTQIRRIIFMQRSKMQAYHYQEYWINLDWRETRAA